jgi:hypothetical protein
MPWSVALEGLQLMLMPRNISKKTKAAITREFIFVRMFSLLMYKLKNGVLE